MGRSGREAALWVVDKGGLVVVEMGGARLSLLRLSVQ